MINVGKGGMGEKGVRDQTGRKGGREGREGGGRKQIRQLECPTLTGAVVSHSPTCTSTPD